VTPRARVEARFRHREAALRRANASFRASARTEPKPVDLHRCKGQAGATAVARSAAAAGASCDVAHGGEGYAGRRRRQGSRVGV